MNWSIYGALLFAIGLLVLRLYTITNERNRLQRSQDYLTRNTLYRSGGTAMVTGDWISYQLRSFDNGVTWYAMEGDFQAGYRVKGPVEEVYPGLLKKVEGMDRLMDRVRRKGPIEVRSADDKGADLLRGAGFHVGAKRRGDE
jgi:hypothetical protein